MIQRKRNRFTLLKQKKRKRLVDRGINVLTSKRDALTKEFHGVVRGAAVKKERLNSLISDAFKSHMIARGSALPGGIVSAAASSQTKITFPVSVKNVWGVKIPELEIPDAQRDLFGRGSAPVYRSPVVDETADRFEKVINAIMESAVIDTRLEKIGAALKNTGRRVNSLKSNVKPEIDGHISEIESYLEETSREEIFRMKRFKSKRAAKNMYSGP